MSSFVIFTGGVQHFKSQLITQKSRADPPPTACPYEELIGNLSLDLQ